MAAVLVLLLIVFVGLLITRIATAALMATGMSRQFARFQSRSAFTGVGFTTSEAEMVVSHPIRRRVVMVLMVLGNAGIATVVATLLIGFGDSDASQTIRRSVVLVFGLAGIWLLAASTRVDRALRSSFVRLLGTSDQIHLHDYAGLLHVGRDYTVGEVQVQPSDWLADRTLAQLRLRDEGVNVLGLERNGTYIGSPTADTVLRAGDTVIMYGRTEVLENLDERRRSLGGELSHADRVAEHAHRVRQELRVAASAGPADPPAGPNGSEHLSATASTAPARPAAD